MKPATRRIAELRPHPDQAAIYGGLPATEYQTLLEDIRQHGLRQPVEITPAGVIIDGHQRVHVYEELGHEEIPVSVREGLDDNQIKQLFITANLHRRQLDPLARARAFKALAELECKTARRSLNTDTQEFRDRLAQQIGGGVSGRTVDRYLRLLTLPKPIQDAVSQGLLPMSAALRVASASKKIQQQIAAGIEAGEPAAKVVSALLPTKRKETPKTETPEPETSQERYWSLLDFLVECLDDLADNAEDNAGTVLPPGQAASLLERAITFCTQMREQELRKQALDLKKEAELYPNVGFRSE